MSVKLQGTALFFATMLMMFVSLIISSVLLMTQYKSIELNELFITEQLITDAGSGLNLLLGYPTAGYFEKQEKDMFGDGEHKALLTKKPWGCYDVLLSSASKKGKEFSKAAMVGEKGKREYCLYLSDKNSSLTLTGNTQIIGDAFLPEKGLDRGYISGKSYSGKQLILGNKQKSNKRLPAMNPDIITRVTSIFNGIYSPADSLIEGAASTISDSLMWSFKERTMLLNYYESVYISGTLKGNILLHSTESVTISSMAKIEDVQIYAPRVIIEFGFHGSVQVFGSDEITIEEGCILSYPSAIVLLSEKERSEIVIKENVTVQGSVSVFQVSPKRIPSKLYLSANSVITGEVYVNGDFELRGAVHGKVTCDNFILNTGSGVYSNYLMDATIDVTKLPDFFVSGNLQNNGSQSLVKWLY